MVQQAIEQKGAYLKGYLRVGVVGIWISRVKGGGLEARSSPPQMFLAFSSLVTG